MEESWTTRELPVLDALVRRFEERGGAATPIDGQQLADQLGMPPEQVSLAVEALRPSYVDAQILAHPDGDAYILRGVTDEARRAVGQWPTPEAVVERIARALIEAADREPDQRKRSRLRAAGEALLGFGKDVAANAVANAAMLPFTGG
jgi:hypothetical protein